MSKKIRVLLVDDSPVVLAILKRMLSSAADIEVVGTASNGEEGLRRIPELNPDVICTDLHMPKVDGFEFTREVMAQHPRPILVVSISVQEREDQHNVFRVLEEGAVDVFPKPRGGKLSDYDVLTRELIRKIRILSGVVVFTKRGRVTTAKPVVKKATPVIRSSSTIKVVAIGASTGGPQALHRILGPLPFNLSVPIICVQHISEGFLKGLVDWLAYECKMRIKIARTGEKPQPGTIYFPEENKHLEINSSGEFYLNQKPPYTGHRPSASVMFSAVAKYYGNSALAILLTGMGKDGAEGLLEIHQAGGVTIAQDEATSIVFGMPKAAIDLGAARYVLPLDEISSKIISLVKR